MLESFMEVNGDAPLMEKRNILFDHIAQIKIGHSGYVSLLDTNGTYVVSKERQQDGENLFAMDETRRSFMRRALQLLDNSEAGDPQLIHYKWSETGTSIPRMKMSVLSLHRPWNLIIAASIYYTDFKSFRFEGQLKRDLRRHMADQRIGESGYLWAINSDGEYVVSKDLLRDGEDISQVRDQQGRLIAQDILALAKKLQPDETGIHYYTWQNLGERQAYQKVAAITYIPEWDWIVGASAYHKDFLPGLMTIQADIIKVCISAIVIGSVLAYLMASILLRPVMQLQRVSIQASKGDLNVDIAPEITSRKDEIGSLARAFDTMIVSLNRLIRKQEQTNVTLARAKERAEAANQAKSDFLARMSHEIRTPLNAVTGLTTVVLKSELTARQRDRLNKVQIAAGNLLEVINDILDFSKVEAGRLELNHAPFDLDEVLERLGDLFSNRLAGKQIELIFAVTPQVPRQLTGDAGRLSQVLTNLVDNAVKFTDHGEIVVRVEPVGQVDKHTGLVNLSFSVSDTGLGIGGDVLPTLFEPFIQVEGYLSRTQEGAGLGLAICRRLVELMGGRIWVESTLGKGSDFSFSIRLESREEQESRFKLPPGLHGLRTLVVDDSPAARQGLTDLLTCFSFPVSAVESGSKAMELLQRTAGDHPFQLILLDWKMPGMDYLQTATAIHDNPDLGRPAIIILVTACDREQIQVDIDLTAVDALLMKPVKPSKLYLAIMELFGQSEGRALSAVTRQGGGHALPSGCRVLVVEDSELNREVVVALLEDAGLEVEAVENGRKAVDRVVGVPDGYYDAVLMDIQMPVLDGYAATRQIRSLQSTNRPVPIIALTAHALKGERDKCLAAGMDDYLAKPIDEEQLDRVLLKWLRRGQELQSPPGDKPLLDVQGALQRLGGRRVIYARVLGRFITEFGETGETILRQLTAGDRQNAARTAHTVKGAASTIGATDLYEAARNLEKSIADRGKDTDGYCKYFRKELAKALEAVTEYMEIEKNRQKR